MPSLQGVRVALVSPMGSELPTSTSTQSVLSSRNEYFDVHYVQIQHDTNFCIKIALDPQFDFGRYNALRFNIRMNGELIGREFLLKSVVDRYRMPGWVFSRTIESGNVKGQDGQKETAKFKFQQTMNPTSGQGDCRWSVSVRQGWMNEHNQFVQDVEAAALAFFIFKHKDESNSPTLQPIGSSSLPDRQRQEEQQRREGQQRHKEQQRQGEQLQQQPARALVADPGWSLNLGPTIRRLLAPSGSKPGGIIGGLVNKDQRKQAGPTEGVEPSLARREDSVMTGTDDEEIHADLRNFGLEPHPVETPQGNLEDLERARTQHQAYAGETLASVHLTSAASPAIKQDPDSRANLRDTSRIRPTGRPVADFQSAYDNLSRLQRSLSPMTDGDFRTVRAQFAERALISQAKRALEPHVTPVQAPPAQKSRHAGKFFIDLTLDSSDEEI